MTSKEILESLGYTQKRKNVYEKETEQGTIMLYTSMYCLHKVLIKCVPAEPMRFTEDESKAILTAIKEQAFQKSVDNAVHL